MTDIITFGPKTSDTLQQLASAQGAQAKPMRNTGQWGQTMFAWITAEWTRDANNQSYYTTACLLRWNNSTHTYDADTALMIEKLYDPLSGTDLPAHNQGDTVSISYTGRYEIIGSPSSGPVGDNVVSVDTLRDTLTSVGTAWTTNNKMISAPHMMPTRSVPSGSIVLTAITDYTRSPYIAIIAGYPYSKIGCLSPPVLAKTSDTTVSVSIPTAFQQLFPSLGFTWRMINYQGQAQGGGTGTATTSTPGVITLTTNLSTIVVWFPQATSSPDSLTFSQSPVSTWYITGVPNNIVMSPNVNQIATRQTITLTNIQTPPQANARPALNTTTQTQYQWTTAQTPATNQWNIYTAPFTSGLYTGIYNLFVRWRMYDYANVLQATSDPVLLKTVEVV